MGMGAGGFRLVAGDPCCRGGMVKWVRAKAQTLQTGFQMNLIWCDTGTEHQAIKRGMFPRVFGDEFGDKFGDEFGDKSSELLNLVIILVMNLVMNLVNCQIR